MRIILPKRISLCAQTFKICGRQYELNLPLVHIPNELPYQIGEGSSAEIVAKKNSKSHSLRRVMELKDLEFGTRAGGSVRGGGGGVPVEKASMDYGISYVPFVELDH